MPLVGQVKSPFMGHPSSAPSFNRVRVAQSLVYRVVFCWLTIVPLCLVLFVRLRFTAADYPFDIFKCFIVCVYVYVCVCVCIYIYQMDSNSSRALDFAQVQMNNSSSLVFCIRYEPWCDITCHVVRFYYIPDRKPKQIKRTTKI